MIIEFEWEGNLLSFQEWRPLEERVPHFNRGGYAWTRDVWGGIDMSLDLFIDHGQDSYGARFCKLYSLLETYLSMYQKFPRFEKDQTQEAKNYLDRFLLRVKNLKAFL